MYTHFYDLPIQVCARYLLNVEPEAHPDIDEFSIHYVQSETCSPSLELTNNNGRTDAFNNSQQHS